METRPTGRRMPRSGPLLAGALLAQVGKRLGFRKQIVPERPLMVRSGKVGGSGEALSPEQQATVDRICQDLLRQLGSDFPYAQAFDVVGDTRVTP